MERSRVAAIAAGVAVAAGVGGAIVYGSQNTSRSVAAAPPPAALAAVVEPCATADPTEQCAVPPPTEGYDVMINMAGCGNNKGFTVAPGDTIMTANRSNLRWWIDFALTGPANKLPPLPGPGYFPPQDWYELSFAPAVSGTTYFVYYQSNSQSCTKAYGLRVKFTVS